MIRRLIRKSIFVDTNAFIYFLTGVSQYEKGLKVSDKESKQLNITKNNDLGNWNYTITAAQLPKDKFLSPWVETLQEPLEASDDWIETYRECPAISEITILVM